LIYDDKQIYRAKVVVECYVDNSHLWRYQ